MTRGVCSHQGVVRLFQPSKHRVDHTSTSHQMHHVAASRTLQYEVVICLANSYRTSFFRVKIYWRTQMAVYLPLKRFGSCSNCLHQMVRQNYRDDTRMYAGESVVPKAKEATGFIYTQT